MAKYADKVLDAGYLILLDWAGTLSRGLLFVLYLSQRDI